MGRQNREIPWLDTRDGVYYVFWYDQATKRTHRLSLRTAEAQEAQKLYVAFLTDGKALFADAGPDLSVKTAMDSYLFEHVRPKTASAYRNESCVMHVIRHLGDVQLRHIDDTHCRRYVDLRRGDDNIRRNVIKDGTIRRELALLKAAAQHAYKMKRITLAEMPRVEMPPKAEARVVYYTKDELRFILAMAEGDQLLWDFLMVLYYTGSRVAVIEQLEASQVDFVNGVIYQAKPGERKTKKRRPPIPIDDDIRPILERRSAEKKLFKGQKFYQRYRNHVEGLGFVGKAFPHVMRHTRATLMLADDVPIKKVADRLGDTVATVESTYAHAIVKDLANLGGSLSVARNAPK